MPPALTEKEQGIVHELFTNSNRPYKEIAFKLKMSESAFSRTVTDLTRRGIIKKFTIDIDYEKLGYSEGALYMFSLHDKKKMDEVIEKIMNIKGITEIYEVFSDQHDVVLRLMCERNTDITKIVKNISEFPEVNGDKSTFTIILADEHKRLPGVEV